MVNLKVCALIATLCLAHLAAAADNPYTPDNPLWHDNDRTNDPNSCHDVPGYCTTPDHWNWGWHDARCRSFGGVYCTEHYQQGAPSGFVYGRSPGGDTGGEPGGNKPGAGDCEDLDWYHKCAANPPRKCVHSTGTFEAQTWQCHKWVIDLEPGDDWAAICWAAHCGCK